MTSNSCKQFSRRQFIKKSGLAATAVSLSSVVYAAPEQLPKNEMLGVGVIGTGGRGNHHLQVLNWLRENAGEKIELAAVCDT